MNRKHHLTAALALAFVCTTAPGQYPPHTFPPVMHPRHLPPPPGPLLYVRLDGPAGMKATFYRGFPAGVTVPLPCVVGLRPGYCYRFELSGWDHAPEARFYPALEVRGSLALGPKVRCSDYPAP